jgi:putative intracellular protease/amidase
MRFLLLLVLFLFASTRLQGQSATTSPKPMKRILFVLTSHGQLGTTGKPTGYYLPEVAEPYHVFAKQGYQVDFASIAGGKPPVDGYKPEVPSLKAFIDSPAWVRLQASTPLASVNTRGYDAIYFPGGHGCMWDLPANEAVHRVIREVYERGGVVAAVCHGPAALIDAKLSNGAYLVAGKRVAAFTDAEEAADGLTAVVPFLLSGTLKARGANLIDAPNGKSNVVNDERLITGQNAASATAIGEAIVAALNAATTR